MDGVESYRPDTLIGLNTNKLRLNIPKTIFVDVSPEMHNERTEMISSFIYYYLGLFPWSFLSVVKSLSVLSLPQIVLSSSSIACL